MHAPKFVRSLSLWASLLALAACDDSGGDPGTDADGGGGEAGEGGEGGGGEGGGGEGGDGGAGDDGGLPPDMGGPECPCATCDDEGNCVEASPCDADDQCDRSADPPRICDDTTSECMDGCAGDADCADQAGMNTCVDGRCVQCGGDDDCPGGACADGVCRFDGCNPEGGGTAQCAEGQVCDDALDTCAPDFDCNAEGASCPGDYACLESGACRPNISGDRCGGDAECALGAVCISSDSPARCAPCLADEDCPGAQTCEARADGNVCREPAGCAEDADCLYARTCQDGVCAAPQCDDDASENNDDAGSATALGGDRLYPGLASCDPDWYLIEVPANTWVSVAVRQHDRDADIDLVVYDRDETEIGRSQTGLPTEAVAVGPFVSARPILVEVTQNRGPWSAGSYDLDVRYFAEDMVCRDDGFEVGTGDDTAETGRYVRGRDDAGFGGALEGRICPGDADYICFYIESREQFTAELEIIAGGPMVGGELFNSMGESVATGAWVRGGMQEPVSFRGARGNYCLALTAESDARYALTLSAVPADVQARCDDADDEDRLLTPGTPAQGELNDDEDESVFSPGCAGNSAMAGDDIVYRVEVEEPALLVARLSGSLAGSLGDPVLSVRSTCTLPGAEIGCATGWVDPDEPLFSRPNPAEVRAPLTGAGTYYVLVDGVDPGDEPGYELSIETRSLGAAPRNDRCEDARAVELDADGVAEVTVSLDRARDDVDGGCLGAGAPDAVYTLSLENPSRVTVQVAGTDFAAGAYLVESCGDAAVACGFGFDEEVPAGDYLLVIDGVTSNSRGRVSAQVVVEPRDVGAPGDTCGEAIELAAGEQVRGDTGPAVDDYDLGEPNRCTGLNSAGGDITYAVDLTAGEQVFVEAEPIGGWDLSLYVVGDCADLDGSCVDGSDGGLTESVVFEPPASGVHYIVVDGTNGERGAFNLRWGPAQCEEDADCNGGACVDFQCQE